MEEEKAAAYYDELTRRGSGAARFKQGLGFSSSSSGAASSAVDPPPRGSAQASSSSSFLSQFVKASNSTSEKLENDREKHKSEIESIQNKLRTKDPRSIDPQFKDREGERDRDRRNDRDRDRERHSREIRSTERRRRRSRSRSYSSEDRERRRGRERRRSRRSRSRSFSDEDRKRRRERRRSLSPNSERAEKGRGDSETRRRSVKDSNSGIDYSKLIQGYDEMTPAERVKAKMKLQLSETAAKDTKIGTGSGWERFDFNKDAPLDNEDEDEEIKGAYDDAKVVKHLGQTFRFSNVQARREEEIKAAHDEAMFGAPVRSPSPSVAPEGVEETENEKTQIESNDAAATSLFSDKLLSKKQGSWRDRAPRNIK